jgi:hypothetical protein
VFAYFALALLDGGLEDLIVVLDEVAAICDDGYSPAVEVRVSSFVSRLETTTASISTGLASQLSSSSNRSLSCRLYSFVSTLQLCSRV